ncbi:MAG: hypothetical protein ACC742_09565 [Thermoanaerobaculales bacterium]
MVQDRADRFRLHWLLAGPLALCLMAAGIAFGAIPEHRFVTLTVLAITAGLASVLWLVCRWISRLHPAFGNLAIAAVLLFGLVAQSGWIANWKLGERGRLEAEVKEAVDLVMRKRTGVAGRDARQPAIDQMMVAFQRLAQYEGGDGAVVILFEAELIEELLDLAQISEEAKIELFESGSLSIASLTSQIMVWERISLVKSYQKAIAAVVEWIRSLPDSFRSGLEEVALSERRIEEERATFESNLDLARVLGVYESDQEILDLSREILRLLADSWGSWESYSDHVKRLDDERSNALRRRELLHPGFSIKARTPTPTPIPPEDHPGVLFDDSAVLYRYEELMFRLERAVQTQEDLLLDLRFRDTTGGPLSN